MSLKGSVKRQSGASVLLLIIMIVAILLFAYYVILGRDLPERLNIPQVMLTNSAGEGSPDSGEKIKPEKSSLWADSSVRGQADKVEKSVRKSKRVSRTFEVLKQSNLVIEEILLEKR